jgi:hypothetical protein
MARGPNSRSPHVDADSSAEETLTLDHARWSGFRDGIGERENGVDEQGFSIELLRLRKELSPFALPLTDRILRLIDFDRPGATRALRVDQDDNSPRLVLVSERAAGIRLSELLERGAERGVIPDLGAALFVMRRLLATAVAIHRQCDVCHLAIGAERIVVTPRGNVVIVEAALAGALEAFGNKLPPTLKQTMRLARADEPHDAPQVDIARIALVGMAMIVGRPLPPDEEIDPLSPVVQEVCDVAAVRAGDMFAAALTPWIDRAISIDRQLAFPDFEEALEALAETMPPAEARCSISKATVRQFLASLSLDPAHLAQQRALDEDRTREIRARQSRNSPSVAAAVETSAAHAAEEDPIAALMDMPVEVVDLSAQIIRQPVAVDDQPSAIAAVIREVVHDLPQQHSVGDEIVAEAPNDDEVPENIHAAPVEAPPDPEPAEVRAYEIPSDDVPLPDVSSYAVSANETAPPEDTSSTDAAYQAAEVETASLEEPSFAAPSYAALQDETSGELAPYQVDERANPAFGVDPSLEDLLSEILRRGDDADLPELSPADQLLAYAPAPDLDRHGSIHDAIEAQVERHSDHTAYRNESAEAPVDEPPAEEPPVEEPDRKEPPAYDPPPSEPPAEEPPAETPTIDDPPAPTRSIWRDQEPRSDLTGIEPVPEHEEPPPTEEPAPLWMRAAIEQVARTRGDRPISTPPPPRAEVRGPVFEIPDEPVREREAETTTLSDIAKELGLTIQPDPAPPAPPWDEPPAEVIEHAPEAARVGAQPEEQEAEDADEEGWDEDIRRALLGNEAPTAEGQLAATELPDLEPLSLPTEPPPLAFEPPSLPSHAPAAVVGEPAVSQTEEPPGPSFGERFAEVRESSGRFLKIAAGIAIAIAAVGGLWFGGRSYYSSITAPGTLVVESTPPGAQVTIDGQARGTTPLAIELPPGSHTIELKRRDLTRRFEVEIRPGEQATQTFDWSTIRAVGSLAVVTDPPGARVSVDGKSFGVTPVTIPDLPAGRRRVVLEGASGTVRREVTIETDRTTTLNEAIFSGFLAVFAPVELQIFAGSKLLGTTENSRIMIPAGRHELTLVNTDLGTRLTRTVEVEPGQVAAVNITEVPASPAPHQQ